MYGSSFKPIFSISKSRAYFYGKTRLDVMQQAKYAKIITSYPSFRKNNRTSGGSVPKNLQRF